MSQRREMRRGILNYVHIFFMSTIFPKHSRFSHCCVTDQRKFGFGKNYSENQLVIVINGDFLQ